MCANLTDTASEDDLVLDFAKDKINNAALTTGVSTGGTDGSDLS